MKPAFTPRSIAIVGSALLGGTILFSLIISEERHSPLPSAIPRTSPLSLPQMPAKRPSSDFGAIVQRPLFLQARKAVPSPTPEPVATIAKQEVALPPLTATLVGIIISPNTRAAVLRMGDGKHVSVAEGEAIEGWKLSQVMPQTAKFQYVATTIELSFPVSQASTTPTRSSALPMAPVRRR